MSRANRSALWALLFFITGCKPGVASLAEPTMAGGLDAGSGGIAVTGEPNGDGEPPDAGEPGVEPVPDAGTPGVVDAGRPVGPVDVTFSVDTSAQRRPISRYIYGKNFNGTTWAAQPYLTLNRLGGNRWTAYNWENNASNAGSDYNHQSDSYLGGGSTAGEAVRGPVATAQAAGGAMLVTVPIAGWVAADKLGTSVLGSPVASRFHPISNQKPTAPTYPPSLTDSVVYQDEFVAFLEQRFPGAHADPAREVFYCLDNEPDLWSDTHSVIHPDPVTYAELLSKSLDAAKMVKRVAPQAKVFGGVNYGYGGYIDLQSAPDANNREFLDFFLAGFRDASAAGGVRLLDVLDLHWYPEARGGGSRITGESTGADVVAARVQAPRSLWDPAYVESSWITSSQGNRPINLLPWLATKLDAFNPGTLLAFTEYYYGGGAHISGAVAQADVLGVFGREGVFAAALWPMVSNIPYIDAAFRMFRSYDGVGGAFGDTSVRAATSDVATATVYASVDSSGGDRVVLVAINKATTDKAAAVTVAHAGALTRGEVWQLTSASTTPARKADLVLQGNAAQLLLPALSVTTVVLRP